MRRLESWPSLRGAVALLPTEIHYERGVWGKAHGVATDYRWLAATPGFAEVPTAERELKLGLEERPRPATLWLYRNDVHQAVTVYPSRALDSSGRRGFLEKQVARWRRQATGMPPALAALLLLPEVERWDDVVWWARKDRRPWSEAAYRLPLEPDDHPALPATEELVLRAVEHGLRTLRDRLPQRTLVDLYGALLDGDVPVVLGGQSEPLPASALAALLLPLPAAKAARLSLAGWIPSRRFDPARLQGSWDLLCTDLSTTLAPCRYEVREQAERLAEAVVTGCSEGLEPVSETSGREDAGSSAVSVAQPSAPPAPSAFWRPAPHLDLGDPGNAAPQPVQQLHRFACDPSRRWIDLAELSLDRLAPRGAQPPPPALGPNWSAVVRHWADQVESGRPPYAHRDQWAAKVVRLRQAADAMAGRLDPPVARSFRDR